jgi:hypothetical protein
MDYDSGKKHNVVVTKTDGTLWPFGGVEQGKCGLIREIHQVREI